MGELLKKYLLASVILLTLVVVNTFSQAPDTVTELDPGISVGVDLNRTVRLDFTSGREKSEELDSSKWKVNAGASFRMKPLFTPFINDADSDKQHLLVIAAAYEYSRATEAREKSVEHKLMLDATGRYAVQKKMLMTNRSRFEFRWVNRKYHFRYRNRLMFERPVKINKFKLTPYGSAEAFWDQRYSKWNQLKFTGGAQIPFIRRTSLDLYYERAHCVTCATPHTNIFGVTLNLFFRRKK